MKGLVEIELGHSDVVLEAARHRVPPCVDSTEHRIAVSN